MNRPRAATTAASAPTGWSETEITKVDLKLQDGRLTGSVHLETKDGGRGYEAEVLGFLEAKDGKVTRFDVVVCGQFWGQGHTRRALPLGISRSRSHSGCFLRAIRCTTSCRMRSGAIRIICDESSDDEVRAPAGPLAHRNGLAGPAA
jgi:hypothetical protein